MASRDPAVNPSALAYDTRDILIAPPSPPSPNTTSSSEPSTPDCESSHNFNNTFSHFFFHQREEGHVVEGDVPTTNIPLFQISSSPQLNEPHLMPDIEVVDVKCDLFPNPPLAEFEKRPEDEEALLSNYCDEYSALDVLISTTSSLDDRLKVYKQPIVADDESDTSSMDDNPSEPLHHAHADDEEDIDVYQFFQDTDEDHTEHDCIAVQEQISTSLDTHECVSSLQLIIETSDQQSSISFMESTNSFEPSHHPVIPSTKAIPLIKPPPAAKFAKWLMSQPSLMGQSLSIPLRNDFGSDSADSPGHSASSESPSVEAPSVEGDVNK